MSKTSELLFAAVKKVEQIKKTMEENSSAIKELEALISQIQSEEKTNTVTDSATFTEGYQLENTTSECELPNALGTKPTKKAWIK